MKTNLLKRALPVMVFMMAIAFAFASENVSSESEETLVTGYIFQNGKCITAPKDCNQLLGPACIYLGNQVYLNKEGDTSCSVPMTHRP